MAKQKLPAKKSSAERRTLILEWGESFSFLKYTYVSLCIYFIIFLIVMYSIV